MTIDPRTAALVIGGIAIAFLFALLVLTAFAPPKAAAPVETAGMKRLRTLTAKLDATLAQERIRQRIRERDAHYRAAGFRD